MSKVILSSKLKGGGEPALTGGVKGCQCRDTPTQPWIISHPALQETTNPWLHIYFPSTRPTPGSSTMLSWWKNPLAQLRTANVTSPLEISHWYLQGSHSCVSWVRVPHGIDGVAIKKSGCARGAGPAEQPQSICCSPGSGRDSGGSCGFILNNHCYKTNTSRAFLREKRRGGWGCGKAKNEIYFFLIAVKCHHINSCRAENTPQA